MPRRCDSHLFDAPEWRCHRDHGHSGDHIHYHETSGGLSGWPNIPEDETTTSGGYTVELPIPNTPPT